MKQTIVILVFLLALCCCLMVVANANQETIPEKAEQVAISMQ